MRREMNIVRRGAAFLLATLVVACGDHRGRDARRLTGGDPQLGRELLDRYGCDACHTIPGVRGARGLVGPPLAGIADRVYIAGVLENTPSNLVRWIKDPPAVDSMTAMPSLGVSEAEARHIAAYLYTLR
jgi:cytochrome c